MRALLVSALIPLVTACSTAMPPASSTGDGGPADVIGHWTGTWTGIGLFNSARDGEARVDIAPNGEGRVVLDGAIAAESVPESARQQGANGIRVLARVDGSRLTLRHELGGRLFTANFRVAGDEMVGTVRGANPGVRIVLAREPRRATPPPQASEPPAPVAPAAPEQAAEATPPGEPAPEVSTPAPETEVAAVPPESVTEAKPPADEFVAVADLVPIHFDFNQAALRPDAEDALVAAVAWLKEHDDTLVRIEGYCDDRGTEEYNLALGERRAVATMDYLTENGIATERISTVSYGKERPTCTETTDECRAENRRAEFRVRYHISTGAADAETIPAAHTSSDAASQ